MPTNEFYDSSGYPSTGAQGSSASMRAEFDAIEAGFVKLPTMAGNGGEPVFVNAGGTALETKSIADTQTALGLPAMAGNGGETVFVNAGGTALETKSAADTITAIGAESASNKDVSGGYAGLTLLKINFKNVLNTITSFFTNANTEARTYTFPDKDGTVAMTSDVSAAFIGEFSGNGYQKFTNGIVIQWGGDTTSAVANTTKVHSFPLEFTSVYRVLACAIQAQSGIDFREFEATTTGFSTQSVLSPVGFNWVAIGYITPA